MSTENKRVILVTGANKGIGYDTSYALVADSPNNHVIMAARSPERGEEALKNLQARKPAGTVSFLELDVTDDDSISRAAGKVEEDFGRLDVLVNNAGIAISHSFADTTRDTLHKIFDTNAFGPMLLTNAFVSLLQKSKDPRIINVSSLMGSVAERFDLGSIWAHVKGGEGYRMSKSALNMLTACQAYEYQDWDCKVWAYCPGYVVTDLTGKEDRENRKRQGAENSETSAEGIKQIVEGERDGETHVFVQRYGKTIRW